MKQILLATLLSLLFCPSVNAQIFWPRWYVQPRAQPSPCANGQCPTKPEPKKEKPKQEPAPAPEPEPEPIAEEPLTEQEQDAETPVERMSVARTRFYADSVEIADVCDAILDRLEERYGKPKAWKPFPIYFQRYRGDGIAGYTLYQNGTVARVVCYEPLASGKGGTLDHELTHAFFFYYLNSNFDLFLNEGLAQNSEYRRREALRQTVYRRYTNNEFWNLDKLYGRNAYDNALRIYHQGFSFVDFLIARGGSKWFACFMEELVRTDDINISLNRYYNYKNLKEAEKDWKLYVDGGQNRHAVRAIN
jgi:hypothetical protein